MCVCEDVCPEGVCEAVHMRVCVRVCGSGVCGGGCDCVCERGLVCEGVCVEGVYEGVCVCESVCTVLAEGLRWVAMAAQPHGAAAGAMCGHLAQGPWRGGEQGVRSGALWPGGDHVGSFLLSLPATPLFSLNPTGKVGTCCVGFRGCTP